MDIIKVAIEITKVMGVRRKGLTEEQIKGGLANRDICPTQKELKKAINYLKNTDSIENVAEPRYRLVSRVVEPNIMNTIP